MRHCLIRPPAPEPHHLFWQSALVHRAAHFECFGAQNKHRRIGATRVGRRRFVSQSGGRRCSHSSFGSIFRSLLRTVASLRLSLLLLPSNSLHPARSPNTGRERSLGSQTVACQARDCNPCRSDRAVHWRLSNCGHALFAHFSRVEIPIPKPGSAPTGPIGCADGATLI